MQSVLQYSELPILGASSSLLRIYTGSEPCSIGYSVAKVCGTLTLCLSSSPQSNVLCIYIYIWENLCYLDLGKSLLFTFGKIFTVYIWENLCCLQLFMHETCNSIML